MRLVKQRIVYKRRNQLILQPDGQTILWHNRGELVSSCKPKASP
jgi:hypothetical protein